MSVTALGAMVNEVRVLMQGDDCGVVFVWRIRGSSLALLCISLEANSSSCDSRGIKPVNHFSFLFRFAASVIRRLHADVRWTMSDDFSESHAAPLRPHDLLGSNNRLPSSNLRGGN